MEGNEGRIRGGGVRGRRRGRGTESEGEGGGINCIVAMKVIINDNSTEMRQLIPISSAPLPGQGPQCLSGREVQLIKPQLDSFHSSIPHILIVHQYTFN